jgi:DNA-binding MarR family transcriptional regulator
MAKKLMGAHRATVQRNIDWMEERGLIREVTGQGRYRVWRIVETRATKARSRSDRNDGLSPEDLYDVLAARQ